MFAVLFIVQPRSGQFDAYLDQAKFLKPELEKIDGFIDNERFGSTREKGRVLSLSTWRDEKAVIRWRTLAVHNGVQQKGRFGIFENYHLRVGEITSDTHVPKGNQVLEQHFDESEISDAKYETITELPALGDGKPASADLAKDLGLQDERYHPVSHESFESIYNPGKMLLLASWRDAITADSWEPRGATADGTRHRRVRVIREYGMRDRREAPQYYPDV